MSCWIVIPAKALSDAKSRLAGVLDGNSREILTIAMLVRTVQTALATIGAGRLVVVGEPYPGLPTEIELLPEPDGGLNRALASARVAVAARGASRIVTLAGDLPLIEPADVAALCALPAGEVGIAPDRHRTGTNALSLPLPEALDFAYSYGLGSYELHKAEVARVGLDWQIMDRPGLARDIDEPGDLADAVNLLPAYAGATR